MSVKVPNRVWQSAVRPMLHFYWRFARGMTLGVRGVVVSPEGQVFLVKHSYVSGWHLPGGGVESGESLLQALTHELAEEGNIEMTAPPQFHGVFFNPRISRRDHVAVFVIRHFRQDTAPVPNREIVAHGFFPVDAMPNDTTAGTRARIAEVLGGAPASEHW